MTGLRWSSQDRSNRTELGLYVMKTPHGGHGRAVAAARTKRTPPRLARQWSAAAERPERGAVQWTRF
jgi:hypothetical protein